MSEQARPLPPDAKKVFKGKIYSVWQWRQKLFDGSYTTFERIQRADTSVVVGVLPDKRILLTEDEQPGRTAVITAAGGQVDPGETPAQAARREFREETGYEIGELVPWFSYHPSSRMIWQVNFFIGRNLKKKGEPELDGGERIKVLTYTFDEFLALASNQKLTML